MILEANYNGIHESAYSIPLVPITNSISFDPKENSPMAISVRKPTPPSATTNTSGD